MINDFENYSEFLSDDEDEILKELSRETNLKVLMPKMLSGHLQGKILEFISKIISPQNILELGTFTGYSAICLAKGLKFNGKITTIESNEELESFIIKYFKKTNIFESTNLIIGNALEIIPKLNTTFDLVFIDADKRCYLQYYNLIFDKVKSGGVIIADNIFWHGKIFNSLKNNDLHTKAILEFNEFVKNDQRVEKFAIPVRDGLMVIRKK